MLRVFFFFIISFGIYAKHIEIDLGQSEKSYLVQLVHYVYQVVEGKSLTDDELDVLDKHPDIIIPLYHSKKLANELSLEVCGVKDQGKRNINDEVDAIRHFAGSSILSFKIGESLAREYLTAREMEMGGSKSEEMDLHNNEMGFNYTNDYIKSNDDPNLDALVEKIKEIGAKAIDDYNLVVFDPKELCQV